MARTQTLNEGLTIIPPLFALAAIGLVAALAFIPYPVAQHLSQLHAVETVRVPAGTLTYREPGAFLVQGHEIDAPVTTANVPAAFDVMKYQVTEADYALCVADNACRKADAPAAPAGRAIPVTGVSYLDAVAYAQWLSRMTGESWRLPTDLEWAHFASVGPGSDAAQEVARSMADRWLDSYRRMAAQTRPAETGVQAIGYFGENLLGIADIGGNVWEWTESCFERVNLDAGGRVLSRLDTCGVRVLQGQHRAYMTAFVRDAISGGCTVGTPPDNLGFRLVKDVPWYRDLLR